MKLTFYDNGIPEKCAEKMVAEMFKDWMEQKPNWHYRDAYDNFVKLYPRAATGNHGKRWSTKLSFTGDLPGTTPSLIINKLI